MSRPIDTGVLRERLCARLPEAADWSLEWRGTCTGTNACLLEEEPLPVWRVLATGWQSAGRGRRGRSWDCAPGQGLMVSLALPVEHGPNLLGHWAVAALIRALEPPAAPDSLYYKWPNDLLARQPDGRLGKLAGLLVQTQVQGPRIRAVIGLGLNLEQAEFPVDLRQPATSLALLGVAEREPGGILARWLLALHERRAWLEHPAGLLALLASRDVTRSHPVLWEAGGRHFRARVAGYHSDGGIRLLTDDGEKLFHDGELRLLPAGSAPGEDPCC